MQLFRIECQADQTPLASDSYEAAQRELAKAQHFFDDADDLLAGAFSQAVDGLPDVNPLARSIGKC